MLLQVNHLPAFYGTNLFYLSTTKLNVAGEALFQKVDPVCNWNSLNTLSKEEVKFSRDQIFENM